MSCRRLGLRSSQLCEEHSVKEFTWIKSTRDLNTIISTYHGTTKKKPIKMHDVKVRRRSESGPLIRKGNKAHQVL